MRTTRYVALRLPEAKRYADLTGVLTDLRDVKSLCERFLKQFDSSADPDWADLEVLCVAAIIRYGRTFPSGVRKGIDHQLTTKLAEDDLAAHEFFKNSRDKWIAHSVNPFEENQLIVWLRPRELPGSPVVGVAIQQIRITSLGPPDMNRLLSLSSTLAKLVEAELLLEREAVERIVTRMDPDFLHDLPDASQAELPSNKVAGKARKQ